MKFVLYITEIKKMPNSGNLLVSAENGSGAPQIKFECDWQYADVHVGAPITVSVAQGRV